MTTTPSATSPVFPSDCTDAPKLDIGQQVLTDLKKCANQLYVDGTDIPVKGFVPLHLVTD